jgi:DNA transformation protein and related proteins
VSVSQSFRVFVLEQLGRTTPGIRDRSMFGGVGIYAGDYFFALIADDVLYFKVDDTNRPDFDARGMEPFRPYGEDGEVMRYYSVPDDLLEDVDALRPWVENAVAVARRAKAGKTTTTRAEAKSKGRPQRTSRRGKAQH